MNRHSIQQAGPSLSLQPIQHDDVAMMRRALQLARLGEGLTKTNPMVGAVITGPDGRIIGEGYHHQYGGPHAEVNAINSVRETDRHLLPHSTIYVTLEPCSHYGKTPPCAELIVRTGLRRVVVGAGDPFPAVAGRGIRMISEAGIEVTEGVLREECERLNRRFMTAHREGRPWVQLKWAEDSHGEMKCTPEGEPLRISTPVTSVWMHRQRSLVQGIMAGTTTMITDRPALTCRLWPGDDPTPVTFASPRLEGHDIPALQRPHLLLVPHAPLRPQLERLYRDHGMIALMVEGGKETLETFLREGLVDEIRREVAPDSVKNT